jgi:hypothetical protein
MRQEKLFNDLGIILMMDGGAGIMGVYMFPQVSVLFLSIMILGTGLVLALYKPEKEASR